MGKCRLCGRKLKDDENNYGSSCILKCYSLLNMDYKKIKNKENTLNNRVSRINGKVGLSYTAKNRLTDRYITLNILNSIKIPYYNKYIEDVKRNINAIGRKNLTDNESIKLKEAFELYKCYNNFSPVLESKTEDITLSEVTQNIVWNALNFGLSRYYNKKEYLSGLTQKLQYIFWKCVVGLLKIGSYNISANLLDHAIGEEPKHLIITNGSIVETIKKDNGFKNKIKDIINSQKTNNIQIEDSILFSNGDLAASFHIMALHIKGDKIENKWHLHIELNDTYDFTDLKELHEYMDNKLAGFILSTANNAAMISTSCNVLNAYNVKIDFDYEIGD